MKYDKSRVELVILSLVDSDLVNEWSPEEFKKFTHLQEVNKIRNLVQSTIYNLRACCNVVLLYQYQGGLYYGVCIVVIQKRRHILRKISLIGSIL